MKEIETFSERRNDTTKVFVTIKDRKLSSIMVGNQVVPVDEGYQFHVKNYIAEQIDKCEFIMDGFKLIVKEGEELTIPTDDELKQKEIEELERKLRELRSDNDVDQEETEQEENDDAE